jgi:hypothetical protein
MNFIEIRNHVKSFMGNRSSAVFFLIAKWSWFYGKNCSSSLIFFFKILLRRETFLLFKLFVLG